MKSKLYQFPKLNREAVWPKYLKLDDVNHPRKCQTNKKNMGSILLAVFSFSSMKNNFKKKTSRKIKTSIFYFASLKGGSQNWQLAFTQIPEKLIDINDWLCPPMIVHNADEIVIKHRLNF